MDVKAVMKKLFLLPLARVPSRKFSRSPSLPMDWPNHELSGHKGMNCWIASSQLPFPHTFPHDFFRLNVSFSSSCRATGSMF